MAKLNYIWRLLATGVCFTLFGIGALFLSAIVFPLMQLISDAKKAKRARWVVSKSFALFVWVMDVAGVNKVTVIGAEKLRQSKQVLVLANHPTLIDVVILISMMPNASCVVKRALWNNPFMWGVVRAADYISNSEPDSLVEDCAADINSGNPLVIFPEGTRTVPGKPLKFKRGASYIALNGNAPILPVVISCIPNTLAKGDKWYEIPAEKACFTVEVKNEVTVDQLISQDHPPAIAARKLTTALEEYFTKELKSYGRAVS